MSMDTVAIDEFNVRNLVIDHDLVVKANPANEISVASQSPPTSTTLSSTARCANLIAVFDDADNTTTCCAPK
jgi:hypothetical protein